MLRQKATEVEEAHRAIEGTVTELRTSLGLLEIVRDATHFELHSAQKLITGASSLFLLSLASRAGYHVPGHHELNFLPSYGAGQ